MMNLEEGEEIIRILHKHPALFFMKKGLIMFAILASSLFLFFPEMGGNSTRLITFFAAILTLLLIISLAISWTIYFFDVWVVTNKRIADFELIRLFNRRISVVELEHILSITVKIEGLLYSTLNAGSLYIETAGRTEEFIIKDIRDPEDAKETMYNALRDLRKEKQERLSDVLNREDPEDVLNLE